MSYDPSKTEEENRADLAAQNEAADRKFDGAVMGYYDLSTEDWEATPEKVRDILRTLFAFE